jgi:chemotaxis response regulator CheB
MWCGSRTVGAVLLVDDDEALRRAVAVLISAHGHEIVGEAGNGEEALRLLANGCNPDVILLNLYMPTMNGWEFLARLPAVTDNAVPPVIVVRPFSWRRFATRRSGTRNSGFPEVHCRPRPRLSSRDIRMAALRVALDDYLAEHRRAIDDVTRARRTHGNPLVPNDGLEAGKTWGS